jgi:glycine/D-amino acid oxidase-like deaminating enzyme
MCLLCCLLVAKVTVTCGCGQIASDTRRLVYYFRKDAEGRLVVGGRGPATGVANFKHYRFLQSWMQKNFSFIGQQRIQYYWSGQVAITSDGVPHVHEPAPGLHVALGFNGKGMAMGTQLGTATAERILYDDPVRYGLVVREMTPYPFWRFRQTGVRLAVSLHRILDHFGR